MEAEYQDIEDAVADVEYHKEQVAWYEAQVVLEREALARAEKSLATLQEIAAG